MYRRLKFGGIIGALLLSAAVLSAFQLTTGQYTTLKNAIAADGTMNGKPNNADGNTEIADLLNLPASPDFWVWKSSISRDELVNTVSVDGTSFSWSGTGYIARSQGERDAFTAIFDSHGYVNPSRLSVRNALADIFSGAIAPAPANRTHLLTVARRKASRFEKLYAVGTGSTAAPATFGSDANGDSVEGNIGYSEVEQARNQ